MTKRCRNDKCESNTNENVIKMSVTKICRNYSR